MIGKLVCGVFGTNTPINDPLNLSILQIHFNGDDLPLLEACTFSFNILVGPFINFSAPTAIICPIGVSPAPSSILVGRINSSNP